MASLVLPTTPDLTIPKLQRLPLWQPCAMPSSVCTAPTHTLHVES
jgi:hypothetical protein